MMGSAGTTPMRTDGWTDRASLKPNLIRPACRTPHTALTHHRVRLTGRVSDLPKTEVARAG